MRPEKVLGLPKKVGLFSLRKQLYSLEIGSQ